MAPQCSHFDETGAHAEWRWQKQKAQGLRLRLLCSPISTSPALFGRGWRRSCEGGRGLAGALDFVVRTTESGGPAGAVPFRDRRRHGCRLRASMDGFTACPETVLPPQAPGRPRRADQHRRPRTNRRRQQKKSGHQATSQPAKKKPQGKTPAAPFWIRQPEGWKTRVRLRPGRPASSLLRRNPRPPSRCLRRPPGAGSRPRRRRRP